MCYGSQCDYELKSGPNSGDCRKPYNVPCPEMLEEEERIFEDDNFSIDEFESNFSIDELNFLNQRAILEPYKGEEL